jgi:hypothetical protein
MLSFLSSLLGQVATLLLGVVLTGGRLARFRVKLDRAYRFLNSEVDTSTKELLQSEKA